MRVEVSHTAVRELRAAYLYLSRRNPAAARSVRSAVNKAIISLQTFPERGRSGSQDGTRELVVLGTPCVIAYRVADDVVFVVRIRHTSQDPSPQ